MLSEEDYREDVGAFFHSMCGTLNHLLVTDRIWLRRLTGEGDHPLQLDAIIHDDRVDLALARAQEDSRIVGLIGSYDDHAFGNIVEYSTLSGQRHQQKLSHILTHVFNHQTHHRGQAHTIFSIITRQQPPSLDILGLQRGLPAPDLAALARRTVATGAPAGAEKLGLLARRPPARDARWPDRLR